MNYVTLNCKQCDVHHINGIRTDNRISNLELWSNRHGKGQRVSDKISHALEILKMYGVDPAVYLARETKENLTEYNS